MATGNNPSRASRSPRASRADATSHKRRTPRDRQEMGYVTPDAGTAEPGLPAVVRFQPYGDEQWQEEFGATPIDPRLVAAAQRAAGEAEKAGRDRRWPTEWVPLTLLIPADYNPRIMPDGEMTKLENSLERYGQLEEIVVNTYPGREGIIIGGHQRVRSAANRRWPEVEVKWVYLPLADEMSANLVLNRVSGEWDPTKLGAVFFNLGQFDPDNIAFTGFDSKEVEDALAAFRKAHPEHDAPSPASLDDEDGMPGEGEHVPVRVSAGDVWALGPHRLYCGDATDPQTPHILTQQGHEALDLVFTSPPYNVGVAYAGGHNDETMPWPPYREFLSSVVQNLLPYLAHGRALCWNIGSIRKTFPYRQFALLEELGLTYQRTVIWRKVGVALPMWHNTRDHPVARNFQPNYQHELVGVFSMGAELARGGPVYFDDTLQNDVLEGLHQSTATSDLPDAEDPSATRTGAHSNLTRRSRKAHPAAFPIGLPGAFIAHLADLDAIVYDPFGGVGSTLVAAEKLGRRGYMSELSPRYCDIALYRWERLTGGRAERLVESASAPEVRVTPVVAG